MDLSLEWHGREAADIVGQVRGLCYGASQQAVPGYPEHLATDERIVADDLLLARRNDEPVGTATSYSMKMWVRGHAFPCQGVAYVGTIKTARRSGGVASAIMRETLRKARERGQVVSALMPFRASFYEHFGYGLVERRASWTIPLSVLPTGPTEGFRFITGVDDARRTCRQRMVEAGQCDIERSAGSWGVHLQNEREGFVVADQSEKGGPMRSWWHWSQVKKNDKDVLHVYDQAFDSIESLRRALSFFATLKDQFSAVTIALQADFPLNRYLKETQVPHRPVVHDTAEVRSFTRMQVRVLDHARLISGLHVPTEARGRVVVAIAEDDAAITTLRIDVEGGRATARPTGESADVECTAHTWPAIVLGDLPATRAAAMGLIRVNSPAAANVLDVFAAGPAPYSNEYF
jgi:predicted acetyltransferase